MNTATPDAAPAVSSPATDPVPLPDLATLSKEERQTWRLTGSIAKSDASAESSSAAPAVPVASTEAPSAPASEPGPPAKKGAEARKAELAAEIQDLLRQRAELRRETAPSSSRSDVAPAVSSPAISSSEKPTWETFEAQIGTAFESWGKAQDAFIDARDAWKEAQHAQQTRQQDARTQVERTYAAASERVSAFREADPDRWATVAPAILALDPLSVARLKNPAVVRAPEHDIAEVIVTSEFTPQWMVHLSEHPEIFRSLLTLPNPEAVYRRMGQIEATFAPGQASAATPVPPVVPRAKTVSSAPPPPPTLTTRAQAPVDEVAAALGSGDFRRYKAVADAQDIARARQGR